MKNGTAGKAWVVSVMMGLGHMRAAWPLRELAGGEILVDGSKEFCPPQEYKVWRRIRHTYYYMSRAAEIPFIGKYLYRLMYRIQSIPPLYPRRDQSAPTMGVRYLSTLIRLKGLCGTLAERTKGDDLPVVHTFYATAMALDSRAPRKKNYLVICDSDMNRVWAAERAQKSSLNYLVPCTQVKERLLRYGVPAERIFLTGFPLPKENIGTGNGMEILKEDLFARLLRLDPKGRFFSAQGAAVEQYLGRKREDRPADDRFTLTFAVGGAGAQAGMAGRILSSLAAKLREGRIRVILAAGVRRDVYETFQGCLNELGLAPLLGSGVRIVYSNDIYRYFEEFNAALRATDVLWTKPSELTFYCALGIPVLLAPTVGAHEDRNRQWLRSIHAGIDPAGAPEHAGEWLFDLRDEGILADAAWDGFLKGRKLGTYRIEELVSTGTMTQGTSPLER